MTESWSKSLWAKIHGISPARGICLLGARKKRLIEEHGEGVDEGRSRERHDITTKGIVEGKHTRSEIDLTRAERLAKGVFHEVVVLEIGRVSRCEVK